MKSEENSEGDSGSDRSFAAAELVKRILTVGINGLGPYKSAAEIAEEVLETHADREVALERLVAIHRRWVGSTGFATGMGGFITLPVTLPADVGTFYILSARMSASIAHVRGYDLASEEVQSVVLVSLLGSGAAGVLGKAGIDIGKKTAAAALQKVPGRVLVDINRRVGYRLIAKGGTTAPIRLAKAVPVVGGGVGAGVNVAAIQQIAKYSKKMFPPLLADDLSDQP